jgi:signal transduction histidine kinase
MRERAIMVGGTLTAAPAEGGGFVVEADLPVAGAPA